MVENISDIVIRGVCDSFGSVLRQKVIWSKDTKSMHFGSAFGWQKKYNPIYAVYFSSIDSVLFDF